MSDELSAREIRICKLKKAGATATAIAKEYGVSAKTIYRTLEKPAVAKFLADLKKTVDQRIEDRVNAQVALEVDAHLIAIWTHNKATQAMREIVDSPKAKNADKIGATKLLNEMWGIDKSMAPHRGVGTSEQPAGPDVYRAAWMSDTKQ